jgi:hypothetical protein
LGLQKGLHRGIFPRIKATDETRIDDRCRPGALTGLVRPGERYKVDKPSPTEIHMRLMVVQEQRPAARLVRRNGRTLLVTDHPITNEDVQRALSEFP